jgi:hypothetical protein
MKLFVQTSVFWAGIFCAYHSNAEVFDLQDSDLLRTPMYRCTYYSHQWPATQSQNFTYAACDVTVAQERAFQYCRSQTQARYECVFSGCAVWGSGGPQCP